MSDLKEKNTKEEENAPDNAEKIEDTKKEEKKEEKVQKEEIKKKPDAVQAKPLAHKVDYDQDVVYVYQFSRTPVIPSISSCCLKLETWLRANDVKYENVDHKLRYRSKKGQLPFVELNGEEIADSGMAVQELSKRFNRDMDAFLTPEQRIQSHTTISMIENHLHWATNYSWRTENPINFIDATKVDLKKFSGYRIPNIILKLGFRCWLKRAGKKVRAHGLGLRSAEEIEELGRQDLKVLSDMLGEKNFYFGDQPALLDIVSFAVLAQISCMDKETPYAMRDWMFEKTPNLIDHIGRVKDKYFPDWDEMLAGLEMNSHLPKPPPEEEKAVGEAEGKDESKNDADAESKPEEEKKEEIKE